MHEVSSFLHILTNTYYFQVLKYILFLFLLYLFFKLYLNGCEVVYHCGFHLNFLNDQLYCISFHTLVRHLSIFCREISIQVVSLLFNWVVYFFFSLSVLYIFWVPNSYPDIGFIHIFSHSVGFFHSLDNML